MRIVFFGNPDFCFYPLIKINDSKYQLVSVVTNMDKKSGRGLNLTPSFTPGIYHEGDGKDLGHLVEFKSELQISLDLSKTSELGFSYNHISNASLGDKNPGANSYMFNFFKNF